ncbi:CDGSH iron-sulfur domain-containing protein 2 -like protein A [Trichinella pseudospiralis]|uniref:CDGSH iron-sulfur domain-containing protein 2-like protein A n=1 Tax=Trichinella pseudospiralis TaxID=6337 RepID=A0A0V1DVI3_TRIPS|nr:CDGSH iron-sulfur domain-containing protein 2 -like protein A [Trichinella pseudospiralis]KRY65568.1 CDGSH iron-sulfur domain-containing protein 2 -like protein A [Trichinella pseudospiralis]KRZ17950.1 CDGSH iron-sulfur domain-containing protein 2 -like protein A [Trichinella pseudospiralis]KRZ38438.1 CDGSH iron-sulfur domain-containing protein 2 -like protein A [Trichinella pseudospiralis]
MMPTFVDIARDFFIFVVGTCTGFLISKTTELAFKKEQLVNLSIEKESSKIVHSVDIEDIADLKAYCRCWRSKSFPFCDGSHTDHNINTGDNVGPLIVKRSP